MTATKEVLTQIDLFLATSSPEVLCVTGKWGVGKTYTWDRQLLKAIRDKKVALGRYAYVSLFGINSLDDFKYAIFENTTTGDQIASPPNEQNSELR